MKIPEETKIQAFLNGVDQGIIFSSPFVIGLYAYLFVKTWGYSLLIAGIAYIGLIWILIQTLSNGKNEILEKIKFWKRDKTL